MEARHYGTVVCLAISLRRAFAATTSSRFAYAQCRARSASLSMAWGQPADDDLGAVVGRYKDASVTSRSGKNVADSSLVGVGLRTSHVCYHSGVACYSSHGLFLIPKFLEEFVYTSVKKSSDEESATRTG